MSAPIRRVLVLNVGKPVNGDVAQRPEAVALREARPEYVVFVCSAPADDRDGSLDFVADYAALVGLPADRYEVLPLSDPDDLVLCYQALVARFAELRQRFPTAEVYADYTAGTKSMSAALVLAALDSEGEPEIKLRLVRGVRGRQATVIPGTEDYVAVSGVHDVRARRAVALARAALERFDYAEAEQLLGGALQREVSRVLREQLQRARALCRAFDAWDRYELELAQRLLEPYRRDWHPRLSVLGELRRVVSAFTSTPGQSGDQQQRLAELERLRDPYIAVEDVLYNAERRAAQGRYDDAVARVYRALELLVQLRLWLGHRIDTSAVDLTRVPEELRAQYAARQEAGRPLTLALSQAWDLLSKLPGEPLADWLGAERNRLLDWTRHRNLSLLAHGFSPVSKNAWHEYGRKGIELCRTGLAVLAEKKVRRPLQHDQFPQAELLSEVTEEKASG